jgi:hypothetical protein
VWGAAPARRGAAPTSGEVGLRSKRARASFGSKESERERERKLEEGERGRSSAFYIAREGEERASGINGAIRERTWGRREREGPGGVLLRRRTCAGRGVGRARGTRVRDTGGRRERGTVGPTWR